MKNSAITKVLNRLELNDSSLSLGFRRFFVLPNRIKMNIKKAYLRNTGSVDSHDYIISFFEEMTEKEYKNYLIFA
tara:strand:- start:1386 stop:1610 length:225 start_codon:yes stop_codon:yes gene_type:complete